MLYDHSIDFMFLMQNELSFAVRSIRDILEDAKLKTGKCDISMKQLANLKEPGTILVAEAEQLAENNASRVFLFDLCIEKNTKLVLIGWEETINGIKDLTSSSLIVRSYPRPINAKEVADDLLELYDELQNKADRKKVLIIDDSPTFLRTASEWLENDFNVSICPSATAAFHMIEANRPDLILLDYEMPVCNGAQFLEMIHSEEATYNIPVIFLTSRSDTATVKEIVSLRPQGYLLKDQPKALILKNIRDFFDK